VILAARLEDLVRRALAARPATTDASSSATATGAVSNVQAAVFSAATDQVPGLATTTGTLKFTFTTATTIPSGAIIIRFNSNYLHTVGAFTTTMGTTPTFPHFLGVDRRRQCYWWRPWQQQSHAA
jgi:hypothetical protein